MARKKKVLGIYEELPVSVLFLVMVFGFALIFLVCIAENPPPTPTPPPPPTPTETPYPINYDPTNGICGRRKSGEPTLFVAYKWESSTGKLSDLEGIMIKEHVVYPDGQPWTLPHPWDHTITVNPYIGAVSEASVGHSQDMHVMYKCLPVKDWRTGSSWTAHQWIQYYFPGDDTPYVLCVNPDIVRSITKVGEGEWRYDIQKGEYSCPWPFP